MLKNTKHNLGGAFPHDRHNYIIQLHNLGGALPIIDIQNYSSAPGSWASRSQNNARSRFTKAGGPAFFHLRCVLGGFIFTPYFPYIDIRTGWPAHLIMIVIVSFPLSY